MYVSQRCQYALRALLELSKREGMGPIKVPEIAKAQAIPRRFLEVILGQLKHAGFVGSKRGKRGGYFVIRAPEELTVGDVVRFIDGPVGPVSCVTGGKEEATCPLNGTCAFLTLWQRLGGAIDEVLDTTTFAILVSDDARIASKLEASKPTS